MKHIHLFIVLIFALQSCKEKGDNVQYVSGKTATPDVEAIVSGDRAGGFKAKETLDSLMAIATTDEEKYRLYKGFFLYYKYNKNDLTTGLKYADSMYIMASKGSLRDKGDKMFDALSALAEVYYQGGRYADAFRNFEKAQSIVDTIKSPLVRARHYHSLGMAYYQADNFLKAANFFQQSAKALTGKAEPKGGAVKMFKQEVLDNIALSYAKQKKYDTAIYHYRIALEYISHCFDTDTGGIDAGQRMEANSVILGNLGDAFGAAGQYDSATKYLKQAIQLSEKAQRNPIDRTFNQLKLAQVLAFNSQITEAKKLLDTVETFYCLNASTKRAEDSLEILFRSSLIRSTIYSSLNEPAIALKWQRTHDELREKKWQEKSSLMLSALDNGFSNAVNEKQIELLAEKNKTRSLYVTILILICCAVSFFLFLLWRMFRESSDKVEQLEVDKKNILHSSKTAHQELLTKSERERLNYLALLENTEAALWSVDKEFNLLAFNHKYFEFIYGFTGKKPHVGEKDFVRRLPIPIKEKIIECIHRAMEGEVAQILDKSITPHSEQVDVALLMKPIYNSEGKIDGISCSRRDITQFTAMRETLEKNDKQFQNIAWLQSHIIRGPLSTVIGITEVLLDQQLEPEMQQNMLRGLNEKMKELDEVVKNIVKEAQN